MRAPTPSLTIDTLTQNPLPLYSSRGPHTSAITMLQPRISPNLRTLTSTLSSLSLHTPPKPSSTALPKISVRHASHAAQGRANGPKDSAGRRLGSKKSNTEHVVAGNIIFKQRGTLWHPGENVGMGRDHTIYALTEGYVRYYRNPALHPKRRYIGVALAREGKEAVLPTPVNAPTRRRVGMVAREIKEEGSRSAAGFLEGRLTEGSFGSKKDGKEGERPKREMIMRARGFRVANVSLVEQAMENQVQVRPYVRKDRWYAWRVRTKKYENKRKARAGGGLKKTK